MAKKLFSGTGVAMITPFRREGSVAFSNIKSIVEHLLTNNIDYLVLMGTTSEAATMSKDERQAIVDYVLEISDHKIPIVLGMGGNNTQHLVNDIKETDFTNIDGILSVTPYYNKPSQKGLYNHYQAVSSASPVPIILYNVPSRTSVNMTASTVLELAHDFENIVAVKEASGDFNQVMEIIKNKPVDFQVISGDDALTLPLISIGVEGVISVVANAYPKQFSEMVSLALKGDFQKANQVHYRLIEIIENLFVEGNPAGIKALMQILELSSSHLRLPLTRVSKSTYFKLSKLVEEYHS